MGKRLWGKVLSEVSQRSYVVSTPEGNFRRNQHHLNLENESTETWNDEDPDKQNKDTTNHKKLVEQESRMDQEGRRDQDDRASRARKKTSQGVTSLRTRSGRISNLKRDLPFKEMGM